MTSVYDLGFAAYLIVVHKHRLTKEPTHDGTKYIFTFNLSQDEVDKLYLQYLSSQFQPFDRMLKQLKRMVHKNKQ